MQPLAILALLSAASASYLENRQTPTGKCATGVHVIAIGGGNSNNEYSLGLLSTLTTNITAAIPGSDYSSLPYDKVDVAPNKLSPTAIPDGITTLVQYVSDYYSACPNTKMVIIGYSSGAVISSVPLCDGTISQSLARDPIIANIWYGVETYVPNLPYDTGTCTDGSGTQPLESPIDGCGNYVPLTQSYCDTNDPQCCSGPPEDYEIHFTYPAKYDMEATAFVVRQFKKFGRSVSSSSSSSSKMSRPATVRPPPATLTHSSTSSSATVSTAPMSTAPMPPFFNTTSSAPMPTIPSTSSPPPSNASAPPSNSSPAPSNFGVKRLTVANSNTMVWLGTVYIAALGFSSTILL